MDRPVHGRAGIGRVWNGRYPQGRLQDFLGFVLAHPQRADIAECRRMQAIVPSWEKVRNKTP